MPLWMKTDVLYFNHPKVIQLPPVAQLLYLRSVAYSKLHLTDGYLSLAAVRSISYDLAASVQSADPHATIEEWLVKMVSVGLFDRQEDGIAIHDFLEWNSSKQEVEFISDLRSKSGIKGGRHKSGKKQNESKTKAKEKQNESKTEPIVQSTEYRVHSTEEEKTKIVRLVQKPTRTAVPDEVWIAELKSNPIYTGIDIEMQFKKAQAWLQTNGKGRQMTRKFFGNWLVRCIGDKPIHVTVESCQARVEHGRTLRACGAPSVTPHGKAPRCHEHHKEIA